MKTKNRNYWDDYRPRAHGYAFGKAAKLIFRRVVHKSQGLLNLQWLLYSVGVALASSNNYWSSSEYSSTNAVNVNTNNGNVYNNNKNNNNYVRAFLRV